MAPKKLNWDCKGEFHEKDTFPVWPPVRGLVPYGTNMVNVRNEVNAIFQQVHIKALHKFKKFEVTGSSVPVRPDGYNTCVTTII
ncbi:hypothetical protein DAPPUDRAFT_315595 [Daphnia pulex]|uniref:Uncharacterized protein n=1 Tax=Daphnia pulex TaxID=6669 RepID=E9GA75_DAPPU|nr:hypothetical protein DAPPUDRAFT_315595 [Daphnia pulex]|eukprot:EFX83756.1 hypothetical protein DAPPUDRAFT_315595 [Daphnia pulex]